MRKLKWALIILVFLLLIQSYRMPPSSASSSSGSNANSATQLWKFTTDGSVYYPPVVTDGRVYVISSFVTYSRGSIYCLNASSGAQIWNHTSPRGYGYQQPTVNGGIVYTSTEGVIYAFNASTGATVWNATGQIGAMNDAIVYVYLPSPDEGIGAFDALTGTLLWKYTTTSLGPIDVAGGYAYVYADKTDSEGNLLSAQVYALDTSNGAKRWNYTTEDYMRSMVVAGNYVYVGYSNVVGYGVFALDAATGNQVWDYKTEGAVNSPVVADGLVYVGSGSGNVYAVNALNGTKIWNYTTDGSPNSAVLSDQYLYVSVNSRSEYGNASLYCFDAITGAKVWNFTTEPSNAASSPVVADGQVYVGNTGPQFFAYPDHYVYALNASTGQQIWNYTIEGNAGSLTVADGVVYVGAPFTSRRSATYEGNGAVYALKPVTSSPLPSTLVVIAVASVVMILAVLILVYKRRQKRADSAPCLDASLKNLASSFI